MSQDPSSLDRRGQVINKGDRVFVTGGLSSLWGPFARVISIADAVGTIRHAIIIRVEARLNDFPDTGVVHPFDPIVVAHSVEVTPSCLAARKGRRKH